MNVKNPLEQTKQNKKTTIIAALVIVIVIISYPGENITQTTHDGDAIIHQGTGDINTGSKSR